MDNDHGHQLPLWEGTEDRRGAGSRHGLNETRLREQLEDAGLVRVADAVIDLARPSVGLYTISRSEVEIPAGTSKTGGSPDLPPAIAWPEWKGRPLSFVAQLNLAEVVPHAPPQILPTTGILYFFYDVVDSPWGFDPKDRGGWRVFYSNEDVAALERRPLPLALVEPDQLWFTPCILGFSRELTPPSWFSERLGQVDLNQEEQNWYSEWWFDLKEKQAPVHRLLGAPYLIQGDIMDLECQLASNGVYLGDGKAYEDVQYDHLRSGASDWQLLLQLDSDETAEMMWGDSGMIYYWMRHQDLQALDFSATWLVLQCY